MPTEITHRELYSQLETNGQLLQRIHQEMLHHKQMVEGAFPVDDRGLPDYGGHKRHHMDIIESNRAMGEYKRAVTLRLLQGGIGLVLTVLSFGLGPYVMKLIGG